MILPWLDAVLNSRNDIVLLLDGEHGHFNLVKCFGASNGVEASWGFSCLFKPMPHVCAFNTDEVSTQGTVKLRHCTELTINNPRV